MLVTGDFKYDDKMKENLHNLKLDQDERKIDLLHCDDTCYEKPNYWTDSLVLIIQDGYTQDNVVTDLVKRIKDEISKEPKPKLLFGCGVCKTDAVYNRSV